MPGYEDESREQILARDEARKKEQERLRREYHKSLHAAVTEVHAIVPGELRRLRLALRKLGKARDDIPHTLKEPPWIQSALGNIHRVINSTFTLLDNIDGHMLFADGQRSRMQWAIAEKLDDLALDWLEYITDPATQEDSSHTKTPWYQSYMEYLCFAHKTKSSLEQCRDAAQVSALVRDVAGGRGGADEEQGFSSTTDGYGDVTDENGDDTAGTLGPASTGDGRPGRRGDAQRPATTGGLAKLPAEASITEARDGDGGSTSGSSTVEYVATAHALLSSRINDHADDHDSGIGAGLDLSPCPRDHVVARHQESHIEEVDGSTVSCSATATLPPTPPASSLVVHQAAASCSTSPNSPTRACSTASIDGRPNHESPLHPSEMLMERRPRGTVSPAHDAPGSVTEFTGDVGTSLAIFRSGVYQSHWSFADMVHGRKATSRTTDASCKQSVQEWK